MRIKFEKGMTPEAIASAFVGLIRQNDIIIGIVNMYVQTLENDGNEVGKNNDFFVCKPNDELKKKYDDDVANIRRNRIKVVV